LTMARGPAVLPTARQDSATYGPGGAGGQQLPRRGSVTNAAALPTAAARPGLAARAGVGGAAHERVTPDRGAAPRAGQVGPAVDRQRPVEVAALPVDVDVQIVERGPAHGQRLA